MVDTIQRESCGKGRVMGTANIAERDYCNARWRPLSGVRCSNPKGHRGPHADGTLEWNDWRPEERGD